MIQLICGVKGSGKTKRIIDIANANAKTMEGCEVFLTDTNRYMYDIDFNIRIANTEEHGIKTIDNIIGFIKGLIAGNHDIKQIYIDGAHRILKMKVEDMQEFYEAVGELVKQYDVDFVLTVSGSEEELPDFIEKYISK